jgi:hypothetical protein
MDPKQVKDRQLQHYQEMAKEAEANRQARLALVGYAQLMNKVLGKRPLVWRDSKPV